MQIYFYFQPVYLTSLLLFFIPPTDVFTATTDVDTTKTNVLVS